MSFFIRKKSKNFTNLTKPAGQSVNGSGSGGGGGGGNQRPKNKDYKPRPTSQNHRKKPLGGKRKKFGSGKEADGGNVEKRGRFDKNEEIESSSSEDELEHGSDIGNKSKRSDESQDEFFSAEEDTVGGDDVDETPQEKKLRLAKMYLEEIEKKEKSRREDEDVDEGLDRESFLASRLKDDVLEAEGRLRREIADNIEADIDNISVLTCSKYLKRSVTCLCITEDDQWIFSGSKDGHLFKWSVEEKNKVGMVQRKEKLSKKQKKKGKKLLAEAEDTNSSHCSAITAIAVSSDGKFLASGDQDAKIVIWDPQTMKRINIFTGHRGAIRGLTFRKKKHTLYSCSDDRSVRVWCLDAMGYVESLFGHQDAVTCIDALTRERAVTGGGRDSTIRVWKIVEESQLVYNGHHNGNIDSVKLVNEENFVSCGDDGLISSWNVNRKKPLFTVEKAHGSYKSFPESQIETPRWVSALSAWTNTDLIASGSSDGFIRFWKAGERFKSLTEVGCVPIEGWINALEFSGGNESSEDGLKRRPKFLIVGIGKEHKLGRWFQDLKGAKNGIVIIPLRVKSSSGCNVSTVSSNGNILLDNNNVSDKISSQIQIPPLSNELVTGHQFPMTSDEDSS